jgi:hypothetical protein
MHNAMVGVREQGLSETRSCDCGHVVKVLTVIHAVNINVACSSFAMSYADNRADVAVGAGVTRHSATTVACS